MSLLSPFPYTTQRGTESVGFGQRIWHQEQRGLAQSPCFPPDLQRELPSVPQLLAVCHFLLGCLLSPLSLARSGSSPYKLHVSETLPSHSLTFYPDTQAVCWEPRPSLSVHLYRQPIISMHPASVALLQSSLGLHSFLMWNCLYSPCDLAVQHSCVCVCFVVPLVFLLLSLICRIILKTHTSNF